LGDIIFVAVEAKRQFQLMDKIRPLFVVKFDGFLPLKREGSGRIWIPKLLQEVEDSPPGVITLFEEPGEVMAFISVDQIVVRDEEVL